MKNMKLGLGRLPLSLTLVAAATAIAISASSVRAQVPLSAYTDQNGYLNVQELTCAQLAGTFQEDADYLAAWYIGRYNGLAKKHFAHIARVKGEEHRVIVFCKAHPAMKIIEAMDVIFKSEMK